MADSSQYQFTMAAPIASSGLDVEKLLAQDPEAIEQARAMGLPFTPGVTAGRNPPQPSGTSAIQAEQKPASQTPYFLRNNDAAIPKATPPAPMADPAHYLRANGQPEGESLMSGFGANLAQSQAPATNAPNPPADKTGAPSVPSTITPTGDAQISPLASGANTVKEGIVMPTVPGTSTPAPPVDVNAIESKLALATSPQSATNPTGVPNPRDPNDPNNTKGYRPTKWQRFGRGVLAGAEGLAEHGIFGALEGAINPASVGATPYGAPTRQFSDAARINAGLQANLQQQLTQGATNAETALKEAQAQGAKLIEITPQIAQEIGNIGLTGERVSQSTFQHLLTTAKTVQGRSDVATRNNDTKGSIQAAKDAAMGNLRDAQAEEATAKAELARAGNDPNSPAYKLAMQRAKTASANAAAAQIRANAYALNANAGNLGVDNQGNQIEGGATTSTGKPIGSRFAVPYIKQEGKVAQFNDVLGATDNIESTAQNLVKAGGRLNSPRVATAIADPESTSMQWAQGEFANSGLTPEERDYVTNVKAYKENLQALRQSAGGGVSDAQVNRLMEMAPGANTPDLDYLKRQTGQIRLTANRLSEGLPQMKGGHAVSKSKPSGGSMPPQSVIDGMKDGQYVHGPGGSYQKVSGKLVPVKGAGQ